jgi:hypothetical protein
MNCIAKVLSLVVVAMPLLEAAMPVVAKMPIL